MNEIVKGTIRQITEHLTKKLNIKLTRPPTKHDRSSGPLFYQLTPLSEQLEKINNLPNKTGKIYYSSIDIDEVSNEEKMTIEKVYVQILE